MAKNPNNTAASPSLTKTILVVEDDLAMQGILVKKLKTKGFQVIDADNGKTAMELIEGKNPDLVLLDLMIPKMDGFEVLMRIRNHDNPTVARTPVIVLTNLFGQEDINRANSLNIQGYIVKAYLTTEEIAEKVRAVLEEVGGHTPAAKDEPT
ncbi:MAG: response regulator [Patescibacteria group bacterium]|nr:response regulator [Patescibacteria group bacterium]